MHKYLRIYLVPHLLTEKKNTPKIVTESVVYVTKSMANVTPNSMLYSTKIILNIVNVTYQFRQRGCILFQ